MTSYIYSDMILMNKLVTTGLSIFGFLILIIGSFFYNNYHKKFLKTQLFTIKDRKNLIERLKYDLNIRSEIDVNKRYIYKSKEYLKSIFKNATSYNLKKIDEHFNERIMLYNICKSLNNFAWLIFLMWFIFLGLCLGGSELDVIYFFTNVNYIASMPRESGVLSIFICFFIILIIVGFLKIKSYKKIKQTIFDSELIFDVSKRDKIWKDYKLIYIICLGVDGLGLLLIFLNMIVTAIN